MWYSHRWNFLLHPSQILIIILERFRWMLEHNISICLGHYIMILAEFIHITWMLLFIVINKVRHPYGFIWFIKNNKSFVNNGISLHNSTSLHQGRFTYREYRYSPKHRRETSIHFQYTNWDPWPLFCVKPLSVPVLTYLSLLMVIHLTICQHWFWQWLGWRTREGTSHYLDKWWAFSFIHSRHHAPLS